MPISSAALTALEDHYERLLDLTPYANALLGDPGRTDDFRREYETTGFVKIRNVLAPDVVDAYARNLLTILRPVAEQVTMRHEPRPNETLSDGFRFRRIDPSCARQPAVKEKMTLLFDKLGFTEFGAVLASKITPLVRHIAGHVSYERLYFYIYDEGDYICAHNDYHVGSRVDVQFPVSCGTVAGIRILSDGLFTMHYDAAGSMNVLGPRIWHDVPPVVRSASGGVPQRFNMGLRFTPGTPE